MLDMIGYGTQLEHVQPGAGKLMSVYNEHQALEGLQRLDSQAIGAIYDQYFSEVYRYVRYRISDDAIAEEIASDVFVRLLEAAIVVGERIDRIPCGAPQRRSVCF